MYCKFGESKGYRVQSIEEDYEEGGMDSGTLQIAQTSQANFPYGYLKYESGVHRLGRISPFDSGGNRHTSFAGVDIAPVIDQSIKIEINKQDIEWDSCRAGGQHVNKKTLK